MRNTINEHSIFCILKIVGERNLVFSQVSINLIYDKEKIKTNFGKDRKKLIY